MLLFRRQRYKTIPQIPKKCWFLLVFPFSVRIDFIDPVGRRQLSYKILRAPKD